MRDPLLNGLLSATPTSPLARSASEYCRDYGPFHARESWRFTPLAVLRDVERRVVFADCRLHASDGIDRSQADEGALGALLEASDAPFAALNLALLEETFYFTVAAGQHPEEPIVIDLDALGRTWCFSRISLRLEAAARASFWFDMGCEGGAAQLPLMLIVLEEGAELEGVLWQNGKDESENAQLLYVRATQAANSILRLNAVQKGSALARVDVHSELNGDRADFTFGGIQMLDGDRVGDFHVDVRHQAENGRSHQLVRGALDGKSTGIFDGLIYVANGAQLTDARQESRFILLSQEAKAQSVPRLEIYADDVRCAHGSTVGFLDREALFYLQSRGIGLLAARNLLLLAFLKEAVVVEETSLNKKLLQAITAVSQAQFHA